MMSNTPSKEEPAPTDGGKPVELRRLVRPSCYDDCDDCKAMLKEMEAIGFTASLQDIGEAYAEFSEEEYAAGWLVLDFWKHPKYAAEKAMKYLSEA